MTSLLKMQKICKRFGENKVLIGVDVEVNEGEVVALLGENGAGKSTLIKILGGIYKKDEGKIFIQGEETQIASVADARKYGVSIIHQELMLASNMSIAENIFMGQERGKFVVDTKQQEEQAQKMIDQFGMNLDPKERLKNLTIAQQQMVEIIRAVSFGAKIIVMDEPTSSLSEQEVKLLFNMIRQLKKQKVGIIYISHRLNELDEIADKITVLRDGETVGTVVPKEVKREQLIAMMVGRELSSYYTKTETATDKEILVVDHLADGERVKNVSFTLHKGEILGIGGLVGAGRSETMECLFGLTKPIRGEIKLEGKAVNFKSPQEAMASGIGFVSENRKEQGLFLQQSVRFNTSLTVLEQFLKNGRFNTRKEKEMVDDSVEKMQIKITGSEQKIGELSGGNQQKVIIAKWLLSTKKILILDEPTRGVDVKTKAEIYHLMNELAKEGLGIIMVSSELPELINMSDRVVVLCNGVSTGILERKELSQESIMTLATTEEE